MTDRQLSRVAALVLLLCVATRPAAAQTREQQRDQQVHRGTVKIWIGTSLIAAGAIAIPATAALEDRTRSSRGPGLALVAAGMSVMCWGFHDRQTAVQPNTSFGFTVGPRVAVIVRRVF